MRHRNSGRDVAIKILKPAGNITAQREDRLREVRLVARSRHPNILRVYGTGHVTQDVYALGQRIMADGQQYLVTEFASGGPLVVSSPSISWDDLTHIVRSVLLGLARVHARGIVHLDLKPANILKCGGRIVVADFGIARWSHMNPEDESVHTLMGTPNYMAPEQISCQANLYGPWTDLYALGCLTYALVAGKAPFARSTLMETLVAHKTEDIAPLSDKYGLPKGFDDWLSRMTAKSWNQRFHRASEALRYLASLDQCTQNKEQTQFAHETSVAQVSSVPTMEATLLSPAPVVTSEFGAQGTGLPRVNHEHLDFRMRRDPAAKTKTGRFLSADLVAFEDCQLVGRETEQEAIWTEFQRCMETQETGMVEIRATAGMGKTSLADWFTTRAHEAVDAEIMWVGHNPLNGRCDGLAGFLFSYFSLFKRESETFSRYIAQRLACQDNDPLSIALAEMAEHEEFGTSTIDGSMYMSMENRHRALIGFIEYLSSRRPLILVVDDAQWAFDTLRLVRAYVSNEQASPIFIVTTIRSHAHRSDARASEAMEQLAATIATKALTLSPLNDSTVLQWLKDSVETPTVDMTALAKSAQGNPLSMKAVLFTSLADNPESDIDNTTLHALIAKRYAIWSEQATKAERFAIEILAILGHRATQSEWLRFMTLLNADGTTALLQSAIDDQLVEIELSEQISFRHGLFVEVIHQELFHEGRFEILNERAAQFLSDEPPINHERVATHFAHARKFEVAAEHYYASTIWYRDRCDYENMRHTLINSAQCLRKARIPRTDDRWLKLNIFWSMARRLLGEGSKVLRRIDKLCETASSHSESHWSAFVFMERSRLATTLDEDSEVIPFLRKALEMADLNGNLKVLSQIRLELIDRLLEIEQLPEAISELGRIYVTGEYENWEGDDYAIMYRLQLHKRWSLLHTAQGQFTKAYNRAQESLALVNTHPSKYTQAEIHRVVARACMGLGRHSEALNHIRTATGLLLEIRSRDAEESKLDEIQVLYRLDRFDEMRQSLADCEEDIFEFDKRRNGPILEILIALTRFKTGDKKSLDAIRIIARKMASAPFIFDRHADVLEDIIDVAIAQEDTALAQLCVERLNVFIGDAVTATRFERIQSYQQRLEQMIEDSRPADR